MNAKLIRTLDDSVAYVVDTVGEHAQTRDTNRQTAAAREANQNRKARHIVRARELRDAGVKAYTIGSEMARENGLKKPYSERTVRRWLADTKR